MILEWDDEGCNKYKLLVGNTNKYDREEQTVSELKGVQRPKEKYNYVPF